MFLSRLLLSHLISLSVVLADGVEFQLRRRQSSAPSPSPAKHVKPWANGGNGVFRAKDIDDMVYTTDVTVGQQTYTVQLDTGSSDLWINRAPITTDEPSFTAAGLPDITIAYGTGAVAGEVVFAPVSLGLWSIPHQAMMDLHTYDPVYKTVYFDRNISGMLGLGFNGVGASVVHEAVGAPAGNTFLANIFAKYPTAGNFTTFWLSRDDNDERTSSGFFTINKLPKRYAAAVTAAPRLPVVQNTAAWDLPRWIVALDGLQLNGQVFPTTSTWPGMPDGRALALLDTGASVAFLPHDAWAALYASIPGAVQVSDPAGSGLSTWLVPCTAPMSVAFVFAGQSIFLDPRDLVEPVQVPFKGGPATICVNSLQAINAGPGSGQAFDYWLGDSFLRNTFQLYNFNQAADFDLGSTATPFVQLAGLTPEPTNGTEYLAQRQAALEGFPPEADLADPDLIPALLAWYAANVAPAPTSTAAAPPASPSDVPDDAAASLVRPADNVLASDVAPNDGLSAEISALTTQVHDLSASRHDPLVVGLLAGNLALALVVVCIVLYLATRRFVRHTRADAYPVPIFSAYAPVKKVDDLHDAPLNAYRDGV